jgi:predicted alpha/beta hydrolase
VRTHKLALAAQRRFWHTILKDTVQFSEVQQVLNLMDRAEKQATQVYRRWVRWCRTGRACK